MPTAQRPKVVATRLRTKPADALYRKARTNSPATEDEVLNALCDARRKEPRQPLSLLMKKLGHDLER